MPDDELLSADEYKQLQDIATSLPAGHPAAGKVRNLLNSQKTPFERNRPGEGVSSKGAGTAVWEGVKNLAGGAAKLLDPTSGLSGAALTAMGVNPREGDVSERLHEIPIVGAAHEIAAAHKDPTAKPLEVPLAGAGSLVGMSSERAREHATRGEGGAIIGEAAVPALTALTAYGAPKVLPKVLSKAGSVAESAAEAHPLTRLVIGHRGAALLDLLRRTEEPPTPAAPKPPELQPIEPAKPAYVPSEKAATMAEPRKPLGPEFEQQQVSHEIERNKEILRNPRATPEDIRIAKSRLEETPEVLQPIGKAAPAGVKPIRPRVAMNLQADVPLKEQLDPIKAKYPDPAVRQMVRANGEAIVQAIGKNPELMKRIHDLTRVDLRQALINAGEDMGQMTVSNSKFAGEGSIGREEAFNRLLKKGRTPEQIVKLATEKEEGFLPSRLPAQRATRERASRIREARQ